MWIDNKYYNELLEILEGFAKGSFDFDEQRIRKLGGYKFDKLTTALIDIKTSSNNHIDNTVSILDGFIDGSICYESLNMNELKDYKQVYEKYGILASKLESINTSVRDLETLITKNGEIVSRVNIDGFEGKWLEHINSLNSIIDYFVKNLEDIALVVRKVAQGDLTQKITVDAKGEVLELKEIINTMVDQLLQFSSEVTRVAKEVGTDGLLGGQAKVDGVSGTWLDLTNNVNGMADSLTAQVRNIAEVTKAVAKGDLSQKITVDAKGEVLELKEIINTMVDQLLQFSSEVTRVAKEVGTDGLLGGQAKVEGVSGTWLDLTNSVNGMADSLTAQVRNIAEVTKAVAKGDLSQKITVGAKGEVLELKKTINTMVDQLLQFSSEVTRVAKEVGTDGLLGGQAKVDGVSGTWLDLTNNVNGMADSLTAQVRNIAEVTKAVAKGDLSQKITVDAKGEVLELKKTINTMVDQLSQFSSELTRVAKEVGTDGLLGGQAKVEGISGAWLDLTNNVNLMSESLAEVDAENKSQNWIKDGVSILSKEILYKDVLSEQFRIAITQLSRYINAGMGAIYIYNSTDEVLELESSYAYFKDKNMPDIFKIGEGVIGQVAYDKKPILINSNTSNLAIKTGTTEYKVLSTYTSPLVFKDKLVGVVEVATYDSFTSLQLQYLEAALSVLAGSFYASIQVRDNKRLETISITDSLTGLYNRGYFDKVVPKILNKERRRDGLVCFAILDIDFFKKFNDDFGHQMGDEILKKVANVLKTNTLRNDDLCFRVGGEEFSIVFSSSDRQKAFEFMTSIKNAVENLEILNEKGERIRNVTISIGLTCKRASEIDSLKELFEQTDKLLYKAKEMGRNLVVQGD